MSAPTVRSINVRILPVGDDTEQRLLRKILSVLAVGIGANGVDIISDTAVHTGDWWIFHAISDVVISSVTYVSGFSSGTLAGQTLKAGDRVFGPIKSISLTSGTGELYRAVG